MWREKNIYFTEHDIYFSKLMFILKNINLELKPALRTKYIFYRFLLYIHATHKPWRWGVVGNRKEALLWDLEAAKIEKNVKPVPVKVETTSYIYNAIKDMFWFQRDQHRSMNQTWIFRCEWFVWCIRISFW